MSKQRRDVLVTVVLIATILLVLAGSYLLADTSAAERGQAFAGTDGAASAMLEQQHGVTPWFRPVFDLGSQELQSGLFAVQAALGAGVLGYVLGNLRGRKAARDELASADANPVDET